jgi:hypothetical protein
VSVGGLAWDPGDRRCGHHPVDVAAVDRLPAGRAQDQGSLGALAAASLEGAQNRHGQGHGGELGPLPDQVQDTVIAEGLGVVLDPHRRGLRGTEGVDARQ